MSEVDDLVWAVLTSYRFLMGEYNKLKEIKIGHCMVLRKINDNAYKIYLPHRMKTSNVFNVQHLTSYLEEEPYSRMNSLQPEKNDVVRLTIMGGSE